MVGDAHSSFSLLSGGGHGNVCPFRSPRAVLQGHQADFSGSLPGDLKPHFLRSSSGSGLCFPLWLDADYLRCDGPGPIWSWTAAGPELPVEQGDPAPWPALRRASRRCICPQPLARCACPCPTSCRPPEAASPSSPPRQALQGSSPGAAPPRQTPEAGPCPRQAPKAGRNPSRWAGVWAQAGPAAGTRLSCAPHGGALMSCWALGLLSPGGSWVLGLVAKQLFQGPLGPLESSRAWSLLEHAPALGAACGLRIQGDWAWAWLVLAPHSAPGVPL